MHILITGGAGFIGSHLVEYHLKKGDKVHVIDDLSTGSTDNVQPFLEHPDYRFDKADVLLWDDLERATAWAERIHHLAAVVGMYRVLSEPIKVLATNVAGTERLLRAIRSGGWSPQVLFASTSEVYGPGDFSDGNRRMEAILAPRRAVVRHQRFNLDLGLRAWWFGFESDPGHGYYAPSSYESYSVTSFGYWKIDDDHGVTFVLNLGWFRDATMESYLFGGDAAVEAQLGAYRDWWVLLRLSATENTRLQSGAFRAYGSMLHVTRRF